MSQKPEGPAEERRHEQRRQSSDRRDSIRFEPDKEDRRRNKGRRELDKDPWKSREE